MAKKKKKWVKARHKIIQRIASVFIYPFVRFKYGAKIIKCKDKRQRIILANHQTAFDQFFVSYGYRTPIYFVASEDIFSNGLVSKLLKFATNPIPIKKQATDVRAVMNCISVAKEGGTIAIFPEGNRTYSGTTEYMSKAIVKLIKAIKLPLSFFRIEGGYGVQPRWADKVRKGKIKAYTSKTLEPEDYAKMSDDELYSLILKELYVDEREIDLQYKSKVQAEYLERAIYVCPYCGLTQFKSNKNIITCQKCGKQIEYSPNKKLKGVGFDFPFEYVKNWYDYQNKFIIDLPIQDYFENPMYTENVQFYSVQLYKSKNIINNNANIKLYGNKIIVDNLQLDFNDISAISVLGRNKLNLYYKDKVYQIKGEKSFNALKYVNVYYRNKIYVKGDTEDNFLGL